MAKTNWQDPGSSEVRSTHISGLQEAVGKIEDVLDLKLQAETAVPLTEVYISELDRYRIYQAPAGKRNWASTPSPVIKKNGVVISSGFTIDYGGGAIIASPSATSTDTFTADVSYTKTGDNALDAHKAEDATTSEKGHVQLSTSTSSTSTALAATPSAVKAAYDKANAALPKAGGTMAGNINFNNKLAEKPEIKNYSETLVKATGVTGTKALDLSQGNVFDMTLSGNTTFTFTNPAASGKVCSFTLILRQPSTLRTVTWPSSVKWNKDEIPEFEKSKTAVLTFMTVNGGSRWYGMVAGTEFTT